MDITKFNEKLNKVDGNTYVIEEVVTPTNGVYEAELAHDNVNLTTLNVYTGSKLTGDRINTYTTSTPSLAPWKTVIKIYSNVNPLYISYETSGDQVEADDINNIQDAVNNTQRALNTETDRATNAEKVLTDNLNSEVLRAKGSENTISSNLTAEITRAKASENTITNTINSNKPNWDDKYTKNEVDNKLSAVVTSLDYKEHVSTFADLATTYKNAQDGWTVSVDADNITYKYNGSSWIPISANSIPLASSTTDGKMSKQDKIDHDDMVSKRHTHSNKGILDAITQTLLDAWNAAYTHISDTIKHITQDERNKWNNTANTVTNGTVNNSDKLDGLDSSMFYQRLSDQVTQGSNWNNFMSPGTYKVQNASQNDTGAPQFIYAYGLLVVDRTAPNDTENRTNQIYLPHADSDPYIYTRMYNNGGWTGWRVIPLNNVNQKVWTSNNDGASSGLDADLLDGKHASDFAPSGYGLGTIGVNISSSDLNTIQTTGFYIGEKCGNAPNTGWFYFIVISHPDTNWLCQYSVSYGSGNTGNLLYTRTKISGIWSAWSAYYSNTNKPSPSDIGAYTKTESDTKFATKDQISNAGYGDMLKSVYDTNNDGIVDNADKLDGKHYSDITNDINNAIDGIQIGGRNILLKTGIINGYNLSTNVGTNVDCAISVIDESTAPYGKAVTLTRNDTITDSGGRFWSMPKILTVGNVYTWSAWLKGSGTWSVGQEQGGCKNINLTNAWTKYTLTFAANNNQYYQFIFYRVSGQTGGTLSFHSIKLEEGAFATTWTPAPEDMLQKGMTWNDLEGI